MLASEPTALKSSLPRAVAKVDVESSGAQRRAVKGGDRERGAAASIGTCDSVVGGASCGGNGDKGSIAFFSCIELTTFSRSMGVICLPRALLVAESWRRKSGREADESERCCDVVMGSMDIESSDATLVDNSGTSAVVPAAICWSNDHCGGTTWSG